MEDSQADTGQARLLSVAHDSGLRRPELRTTADDKKYKPRRLRQTRQAYKWVVRCINSG